MRMFGKTIRAVFGFNDIPLMLVGIPVISLVMPMAFFNMLPWVDMGVYLQGAAGSLVFTTTYWLIDRTVIAYFRVRMPRMKDYRKRLLLTSAIITFSTLTTCGGIKAIVKALGVDGGNSSNPSDFQLNLGSMIITIAILAIYEAIYAFDKWKEASIESERLKKESMQAQLETLKNQVNPHFLFNSLNAVTSMVHDQPDAAVEFIQKLSKVYRYILEIKDKEMITLREEMECIDAYRFLLKMRFGDNVRFEIDIPETHMQCHIVPLSLQILLENAIKHNVISTGKPLTIHIGMAKNGNLLVSNNLQKKSMVNGSTKTGLANIKSRYKLLAGKEVDVIVTREQFSVSVPLIHVEAYEPAHN